MSLEARALAGRIDAPRARSLWADHVYVSMRRWAELGRHEATRREFAQFAAFTLGPGMVWAALEGIDQLLREPDPCLIDDGDRLWMIC